MDLINSNEPTAWVTQEGRYLRLSDIEDRHLIHILRLLEKGRGWNRYLSARKVYNLFKEADRRKLTHKFDLGEALEMYEKVREGTETGYRYFELD